MSGKPTTMTLASVSAIDAGSPVSGMEAAAASETPGTTGKARTKGKGRALEAAKHERNQPPISAAARATASNGNGDNGNSQDALPTSSHMAPVDPNHDFENESPTPCDVYGAEHLSRLFVSLPELIAQTNMDLQSVTRLREELGRLMGFVGRGSGRFFLRGGAYVRAGDGYRGRVLGGHATISKGVPSVEGGVAGKRVGTTGEKLLVEKLPVMGRGGRRGAGVDSGNEGDE